jgi:hypothetical protein
MADWTQVRSSALSASWCLVTAWTTAAAQVQTRMEQRRHDEFANACRLVLGGRQPPDALVDEVWALGSRAMWFKLAERGWSPDDWEAWCVRAVLDATRTHATKG